MDRYYSFNRYLRSRYGVRVHRIPVNLGLGCPHRENRLGDGGCIFCDRFASGVMPHTLPIEEQVKRWMEFAKRRYKAELFMVYFQAYSSTYAPVDQLERLYKRALISDSIVGIIVGTRPDLVPEDVLDLLEKFSRDYEVWLELGLQSSHYKSLRWMNRRHGVSHFLDALLRSKKRGIRVCAHVILGLPTEDLEDMMETACFLSAVGVDGVKIHHLHVLKDTPLEEMYVRGEVRLFELDEYVDVCVKFLEHLKSDIVIHRLVGEAPAERLVAPSWCLRKRDVLRRIEQRMEELDTYQGRLCPF